MARKKAEQGTSTELTGGAGFTFEDVVVAYYLAALLREERAQGQNGIVSSVAVQQGLAHPMDDVIVEFDEGGTSRTLGLQVKRHVRITAATSNTDFREIMAAAAATRRMTQFRVDADAYGFATGDVAIDPWRSLGRLIDWAKSSPTGEDFERRFESGGTAAAAEQKLRNDLLPLTGAASFSEEADFYRHFVALRMDGLSEGGVLRVEVINRLQELVATSQHGCDLLLFDRLCRIARDGAASGRKWTRRTLLADLRGAVRLKVTPNYRQDIELLRQFSAAGLADVSEEIGGFRIDRSDLAEAIGDRLRQCRLINLSGLPGCGKSAMLKRVASAYASNGPILFLKSDRLEWGSWATFAAALGLDHRVIGDILAEIGGTGAPILFIDGIDRIRPDRKGVVTDILQAIEGDPHLANWKVIASSRDQGLETYRTWFPPSFYEQKGIGDVQIGAFSDEEARALADKKPSLRRLLFGPPGVREIARRPFFAAVLSRSFLDDAADPQTEVDLITAWWERAGHDAREEAVPLRRRALLDLAEKGVCNLGKQVPARMLKDATFAQIAGLEADLVIRDDGGGVSYSFTHDIFFEWVFFRHLIELVDEWKRGLIEAGEPPLLGRVVGLLAQNAIGSPGKWSAGYRDLERQPLRPQWRREWLTAPPFTPAFEQAHAEFQTLLTDNDYALLEKLLVWFQAQHTIPSPLVLHGAGQVEGVDRVSMADLLGWPSDFESWGRMLDWLLPLASSLPPRLLPTVLEVFGAWQNVGSDLKNPRSASIIDICATWLIELERVEYPAEFTFAKGRWDALGGDARSSLATSLRMTIMRSVRSYPLPAVALFRRAEESERMRRAAYSDLMGFAPAMVDVAPDAAFAVAKADLMEELPQDRLARHERDRRDRIAHIRRLRAIPEHERTESQKRALEPMHVLAGDDRINFEDIGINRHHSYYHRPSALHEPFASLFAKKSEAALALVRDLANHATKGWHQVQLLNRRRMGTPVPVLLSFPWGEQQFWGDWHVYNWFTGAQAPQPLECAFLSLSYWAFKQIEDGRPTDQVIRAVVEGNECYAVLGLALVLALETHDVSETTLPIAACQRLWEHDMARVAQDPFRNIDLMGLAFLSRLTGAKLQAKEFLESRQSHRRNIQDLALHFALSRNDTLREQFKQALAGFPDDLPYQIEEHRANPSVNASLREKGERWAGLGDIKNYRMHATDTEKVLISYDPPTPLTPAQEDRLAESTSALQEYSVIDWAVRSLKAGTLSEGIILESAIAFAQARDSATMLVERREAGEHSAQSTISAVAAAVIRFGPSSGPEVEWAWDVMARVAAMREPKDTFHAAKIPWHPANHLVVALVHDRRSDSPHADSERRLFDLTLHPMDEVAQLAFSGLFMDREEHVRWVAAQLALDLSLHYRSEVTENGQRDDAADRDARRKSLNRALERLGQTSDTPLTDVPPAWVREMDPRRRAWAEDDEQWTDANPCFDAQFAAKLFRLFPVEAWCGSALHKPLLEGAIRQLVAWTAERLMPSWRGDRLQRRSERRPELTEWNLVLVSCSTNQLHSCDFGAGERDGEGPSGGNYAGSCGEARLDGADAQARRAAGVGEAGAHRSGGG